MKLAVLVASTIVGFVAGQASVGQLPTCAIPCVNGGIEATGCSLADVHCFCTATAFLCTIAPCVKANCSAADQQNTESVSQQICNSATPPVQLPSFSSLLNGTVCNGTTASAGTSSTAGAPETSSVSSTAAASSSATAKSGSGRIEGDMRVEMAVTAMICAAAIAFFAV